MVNSVKRPTLLVLVAGHIMLLGAAFALVAPVTMDYGEANRIGWLRDVQDLVGGVTYHTHLLLPAFWLVFGPGRLVTRAVGTLASVISLTTLFVFPCLRFVVTMRFLGEIAFRHLIYAQMIPLASAVVALTAIRLCGWRLIPSEPDRMRIDGHRPQFSLRLSIAIMVAAALLFAPMSYPYSGFLRNVYWGRDNGRLQFLFHVFVTIPLVAAGLVYLFQSARFRWRRTGVWLTLWVGLEQFNLSLADNPFPVAIVVHWKNATDIVAAAMVLAVSLWCIHRAGYRLIRGPIRRERDGADLSPSNSVSLQ